MAYARQGYLALKKETTAGTAVYPNVFVELLSETITSPKPLIASSPVYGSTVKNLRPNRGMFDAPTGEITIEVEPNTLGYILTGVMGPPSTTGPTDTTAYTHVFTQPYTTAAHPTFTVDICMGSDDFVRRYMGCKFSNLKFEIQDNVWTATFTVTAMSAFESTRVKTTVSSGTTLALYQTSGLTTSDTIIVSPQHANRVERTVASVDSELQVTVGSAFAEAHTADTDEITIKKQSPSFTQLRKLTWVGDSTYKVASAIGSVALRDAETFTATINREVEARHAANGINEIDRYPTAILDKGVEASATVGYYWTDEQQMDQHTFGSQQAIEVEATGDLAGAASTYSSLKLQLPDVRNMKSPTPNLSADDLLQEDLELTAFYDTSAAYLVKVTVINKVASY
jgi:hypothetical protein